MSVSAPTLPPTHQKRRGRALPWRLHALQAAALPGALLLVTSLLAGCGSPGSPQPPSLKLPTPPADLTAARAGAAVTLRWTMPRRATDRVPLVGDQRVVICRSLSPATACTAVGVVALEAGLPASYTDQLPAPLLYGGPKLLTYTVLLENHNQRSAGPSNPAYSLAGAAPPAILGLRARAEPLGIVLRWQATAASAPLAEGSVQATEFLLRLHRTRKSAPGEDLASASDREARAGVPQPVEQTLEVPEGSSSAQGPSLDCGWRLDHAIDPDAALNRTYFYTVERVARVRIDGHAIEVSGPGAGPLAIEARDLFPPAVPQGLQAVADNEGRGIDLSWTPDADPDLAGYVLYRRAAGSAAPPNKVSGELPLPNAAFRDTAIQAGMRYAYSVSAVDTSSNESARSPEVTEAIDGGNDGASPRPANVPGSALKVPPRHD